MIDENTSVLGLTANIVSAHVSNNAVTREALPSLIQEVYRSLATAEVRQGASITPVSTPAVPIHKSVFPEFIICLESGEKMKMLKRHLMTSYNLTPEAYRAKWGLPPDYPMVAPAYARLRSRLATDSGLGRKREPAVVKPTAHVTKQTVGARRVAKK